MDPQDHRPKRPSLLVGDAEHADAPGHKNSILADIGGSKTSAAHKGGPRRKRSWWMLGVLALAVVCVALWRFGFDESDTGSVPTTAEQSPAASSAPSVAVNASPVTTTTAAPKPVENAGTEDQNSAVIVNDEHTPAIAEAHPATAIPDSQHDASAEIGRAFAPVAPRAERPATAAVATVPARGRGKAQANDDDDDVDLIAALMKHLDNNAAPGKGKASRKKGSKGDLAAIDDDPNTVEERIKTCPPANTVNGLSCRQRICAPVQGKTLACPAPDAASN